MNERIRELAEQSTTKGEWSCVNNSYMEEFDKEKFAQLIVRECINEVRAGHNSKLRFGDVIHNMKIHFGVEE